MTPAPITPTPPGRDPLTLFLAIWGAVLATATVLWNFYRDYRDKGSLKVYCYFGPIETREGTVMVDHAVIFSITNDGRRPVVVQRVGGQFMAGEKGEFLIANDYSETLPARLKPYDSVSTWTEDLSIFAEPIKFAGAWDSLGRIYKCSKHDLRAVVEQIRRIK